MTTEQLLKGEELKRQINIRKIQLEKWVNSKKFWEKTVRLDTKETNNAMIPDVNVNYIDFDVVKAIAVSRLEKELNDLELEFSRL